MPFIAITEKAFSHLVNEQYSVLRRALSAHERLERVVLSERGLEGVASELAATIGGPALIFDGRGDLLASRGDARLAALAVRAARAHPRRRAAQLRPLRASRRARWRCRSRAGRSSAAARRRRRRRG